MIEKGDGVNIRSALIIAGIMLASILIIAASMNTPASFRTSAEAPKIAQEPRTELLPANLPTSWVEQLMPTTTTTTTVPPPTTTTTVPWDTVTPYERAEWYRVDKCEEPVTGWTTEGSLYAGGLGISRVNWAHYNIYGFPADAAEASPDMQIMVAERIQFDPPDQGGCAAW